MTNSKPSEKTVKPIILNAYNLAVTKSISEVCKIAQVSRTTFYFHFNKDADFRRSVIEKQKQHLEEKALVN